MGSWLSRGLDAIAVVTILFWSSIFLAFPAVYLIGFFRNWDWAEDLLGQLTMTDGLLIASSGAALAVVFKYGSSILPTILDVDTYLRTSPEDASPRAKIFERFVSTLRYVAEYRDADGRGYDSLVIVAHSLGSLIAADLLRYLYVAQSDPARRDPALDKFGFGTGNGAIALKLLTMGSPIRQLLNRFFPFLYDWVRTAPDNGLKPLPLPADPAPAPSRPPNPAPIRDIDPPDPAKLGIELWVNAYRSGDYVGRSLWLDEWYNRTLLPAPHNGRRPDPIHVERSANSNRREMCIGAGAHTRYWDDTAPDVAEVLNRLI